MAKTKKTESNEKNETPNTTEALLAKFEAREKEVDRVLDNFRTSFKNFENQLALLKERNRLR